MSRVKTMEERLSFLPDYFLKLAKNYKVDIPMPGRWKSSEVLLAFMANKPGEQRGFIEGCKFWRTVYSIVKEWEIADKCLPLNWFLSKYKEKTDYFVQSLHKPENKPTIKIIDKSEIGLLSETLSNKLKEIQNEYVQESETYILFKKWIIETQNIYNYFTKDSFIKKDKIISGYAFASGQFDLREGMTFILEVALSKHDIVLNPNLKDRLKDILILSGVIEKDILYLDVKYNIILDTIEIAFAFQTEAIVGYNKWNGNYINLISGARSVGLGTTEYEKVYLRGSNPNFTKHDIYDYPLKGFSFPYGMEISSYNELMDIVLDQIQDGGLIADLRSVGNSDKTRLNQLVYVLKEKRWQRIFTPTEKFYLRNGIYIK